MDFLIDFFKNNFSSCVWLAIILVSMCPILESKISIPLALNTAIWGSGALSPFSAFLLSLIGSIIPSYLIILLSRYLKNKTTGFVSQSYHSKIFKKAISIETKNSSFNKYLTLACFVAVPLPLTGVWSGSLIAGLTSLNINYSFISIVCGSIISCGTMTLLCTLFSNSTTYILIFSLIIVIAFSFINLLSSLFHFKDCVHDKKI